MSSPLLSIQNLSVDFNTDAGWTPVTFDVSLEINTGETVALVGESGSGKSVTAMSILNLLPQNSRRHGKVLFEGVDLVAMSEPEVQKIRGRDISVIFQEPMTALNPVYTIGQQLIAAITSHRKISASEAHERAVQLLRDVNMPNPEEKVRHHPHQLSGGQRQRAMIAMAVSSEPKLLIADEPTTALDVTVQAEILDLIQQLQRKMGMGVLIITHDMGVVADVADRVVVMRLGEVVEQAPVKELFTAPAHPYTRELLNAVPYLGKAKAFLEASQDKLRIDGVTASTIVVNKVMELTDAVIRYPGSWRKPGFQAVNGVNLSVSRGEIVGLVGESGSGKSTIGRAAIGLLPIAEGSLDVHGVRVAGRSKAAIRELRKNVSMVFQDPASSLNPRRTIGQSISDPLAWHGIERNARKRRARAQELLEEVQISPDWVDRYPHELSGGQRQRIGIARAVAIDPVLMVADEPTSALDVSVQAAVLDLFLRLQRSMGFSCLFISHDLSVVEALANRVVVLKQGSIIEEGPTAEVLNNPQADYTRRLIAAAPVPDPVVQQERRVKRLALSGTRGTGAHDIVKGE